MRNGRRSTTLARLVLALSLAALVAAPAGVSAAGTPRCKAGQLTGRVQGGSGAAGTIAFAVVLRNGGRACTLKGFAGLRILKGSKALHTRVVHGGIAFLDKPVKRVRLAHGHRATILIAYEDVPVGNEKRCEIGTALRIRPPGQRGRIRVEASTTACGHGTLRESPVLAGVRSVA